jgi:hypothetical protein
MKYKNIAATAVFATAGLLALPTTLPAQAAAVKPARAVQAAQAAIIPSYTCDHLGGDVATARVHGRCVASLGAVRHGRFRGPSILSSRLHHVRVRCRNGGIANVPRDVVGFSCTRI